MKLKEILSNLVYAICIMMTSCGVVPSEEEWFENGLFNPNDEQIIESKIEFNLREQYSYTKLEDSPNLHINLANIISVSKAVYNGRNVTKIIVWFNTKNTQIQLTFPERLNESYIWINDGQIQKNYHLQCIGIYNKENDSFKELKPVYVNFDPFTEFVLIFDEIPNDIERISMHLQFFDITIENIKLVKSTEMSIVDNISENLSTYNESKMDFNKRSLYSYTNIIAPNHDYDDAITIQEVYNENGYTYIKFNIGKRDKVYSYAHDSQKTKSYIVTNDGRYKEIEFLNIIEDGSIIPFTDGLWEDLNDDFSMQLMKFEEIPENTDMISLYLQEFQMIVSNIKLKDR